MGRDILSFSVIPMIVKGGWLGGGKIILSGTADEGNVWYILCMHSYTQGNAQLRVSSLEYLFNAFFVKKKGEAAAMNGTDAECFLYFILLRRMLTRRLTYLARLKDIITMNHTCLKMPLKDICFFRFWGVSSGRNSC